MSRSIAVLLTLAGLAGCQSYSSNLAEFDRQVQFEPAPIYCYRSLGYATCYAKPLSDDQTDRLYGYYGPPPPLLASGGTVRARTTIMPVTEPGLLPPGPPEPQPRMPVGSEPLPRVVPPPPAPSSP